MIPYGHGRGLQPTTGPDPVRDTLSEKAGRSMALVLTAPDGNATVATISCTGCASSVIVPAALAPGLVKTTEPIHSCW